MLKRIISIALIVVFSLSVVTFAAANDVIELFIDNPQAFVNGAATQIDPDNAAVTPIIRNDRTLLPVRFISETLGMLVEWNEHTREVMLSGNGKIIVLTIDSPTVIVNGQSAVLDVAPIIYSDRTYLPLRFISETLEKSINWDEVTRKVTVGPKTEEVVTPGEPGEPAFNGLTFRPVFNNGLSTSSIEFSIGVLDWDIDTTRDSTAYGDTREEIGNMIVSGFPECQFNAGIKYATLAQAEFGKEKLALITVAGKPFIAYLALDESLHGFIYVLVPGDTQASMEKLNKIVEDFR